MEAPGKKFESPEKFPATLDIIKIDGRWAQVSTAAKDLGFVTVRFLDDGTVERADLGEYYLAREFGLGATVGSLKEISGQGLSAKEAENVRWGPEEKDHPHLKGMVTVFGEYKKVN